MMSNLVAMFVCKEIWRKMEITICVLHEASRDYTTTSLVLVFTKRNGLKKWRENEVWLLALNSYATNITELSGMAAYIYILRLNFLLLWNF